MFTRISCSFEATLARVGEGIVAGLLFETLKSSSFLPIALHLLLLSIFIKSILLPYKYDMFCGIGNMEFVTWSHSHNGLADLKVFVV